MLDSFKADNFQIDNNRIDNNQIDLRRNPNGKWWTSVVFFALVAVLFGVVGFFFTTEKNQKTMSPATTRAIATRPHDIDRTLDLIMPALAYDGWCKTIKALSEDDLRRPEAWQYRHLTISQGCLADYNRAHETKLVLSDVRNDDTLSLIIGRWYVKHYATEERLGRTPTAEDAVRIFFGGPDGWRRTSTIPLWERTRDLMFGQSGLARVSG